jgi:hypothetical protein
VPFAFYRPPNSAQTLPLADLRENGSPARGPRRTCFSRIPAAFFCKQYLLLHRYLRSTTLDRSTNASIQSAKSRHSRDKSLPSKPLLRPQDSPQRRGIYDATDLNAMSLDESYPPLIPASSPQSPTFAGQRSTRGSVAIAASLMSNGDRSTTGSLDFPVYGFAQSASVNSFTKAVGVNISPRHKPGPTKAPMATADVAFYRGSDCSSSHGQELHDFCAKEHDGSSPLQPDCFSMEVNASENAEKSFVTPLGGRHYSASQTVKTSRHNHQSRPVSTVVPEKKETGLDEAKHGRDMPEGGALDMLHHSLTEQVSAPFKGDSLSHHGKDQPASGDSPKTIGRHRSRRLSRYGYSITESLDAHDIIMGPKDTYPVQRRHASFAPDAYKGRKVSNSSQTTKPKDQSTLTHSEGRPSKTENTASDVLRRQRTAKPASAPLRDRDQRSNTPILSRHSDAKTMRLTSRSSSQASPCPVPQLKDVKISKPEISTPATAGRSVKATVTSSEAATSPSEVSFPDTPSTPSSTLYRDTVASARRASAGKKSVRDKHIPKSQLPHSRTLNSFSNVGKGMKILGKKVGRFMPGRRSDVGASISKIGNEQRVNSASKPAKTLPPRQTSKNLTTFENSGMDEYYDNLFYFFAPDRTPIRKSGRADPGQTQKLNVSHPAVAQTPIKEVTSGVTSERKEKAPETPKRVVKHDMASTNNQSAHSVPSEATSKTVHTAQNGRSGNSGEGTRDTHVNHEVGKAHLRQRALPKPHSKAQNHIETNGITPYGAADGLNFDFDIRPTRTSVHRRAPELVSRARESLDSAARVDADALLSEADAKMKEVATWAAHLDTSEIRSAAMEACQGIGDAIMHCRTARMAVIQACMSVDKLASVLSQDATFLLARLAPFQLRTSGNPNRS